MKSVKTSLLYHVVVIVSVSFLLMTCKKQELDPEIDVSTDMVSNISYTTCTVTGTISALGEGITQHGFCWSESSNPYINDSKIELGIKSTTGSFNGNLANLTHNTTYYVRAYATNSVATSYGNQIEFTTVPYLSGLIAIIYKENSTDANSFMSLLLEYGSGVNLIEIDNVASTDFSNYNLIIVTSNTSFGNDWGTLQAVDNIKNSGKLVLGLGAGGAGFFEEYGLSINWGNSWYGTSSTSSQNTSIYCFNTTHQVFESPTNIIIPSDNIIQLYSESGHVGEYAPVLNQGVLLIGREPTDANHYSIVSENNHWLWGFTNSPADMTQTGKYLFLNIVSYMLD